MPYVITQSCCNDASCTAVCPVDCIHPRPDEPAFTTTESLYIDAAACIDCGACVEECPVGAIIADDKLTEFQLRYLDLSSAYFEKHPHPPNDLRMMSLRSSTDLTGVRVAIVGSGPAAMYAVWELLEHRGVEVHVYDRSMAPFGLIRRGVAPDHPATKAIAEHFERAARKPNVTMHLGVEVGTHVSHGELAAAHSAVIYATGASADRESGVPGGHLDGVHSATEFVGWYNGDPAYADCVFDLSGDRAVIVGNGNVALDVARILVADPEYLAKTDIAEHALVALEQSNIREVVILGRRGPAQAAYTCPELLALLELPDVDVVIDADEAVVDPITAELLADPEVEPSVAAKVALADEIARRPSGGARRRIVLRHRCSPGRFAGAQRLSSIHLRRNTLVRNGAGDIVAQTGAEFEELDACLVFTSVGYRGLPVKGLPFDPVRNVIPNDAGRVLTSPDGGVLAGVYVTGWIKRGPSGVIGSNKRCARETVGHLLADVAAGVISSAPDDAAFRDRLRARQPGAISFDDWLRVDAVERQWGRRVGRPRIKITSVPEIVRILADEDTMPDA